MAKKKKEMDNLAKDAAAALAAGMSYGRWKAMQDKPVVIEKKEETPEGWKTCLRCGKPFKASKYGKGQKYCEYECQRAAQSERNREKMREYYRETMARRREQERNAANENCT